MHTPHWPLFDLEVRTPRLTLRYLDDEIGHDLCELMALGVHDPAVMPFSIHWTDVDPPELQRNAFRFWWQCRAATVPDSWTLNLAVLVDDTVVGACGLVAEHFPVLRTFETGSWLGLAHQGRGLGTEVRRACLHLGFAGLEAAVATTGAYVDNLASLGVTRKLGYRSNGTSRIVRRGAPAEIARFTMERDDWQSTRRDDIELRGAEAARDLLGIS
jgi:RimJ/RimL family protein N-acetyltransferase